MSLDKRIDQYIANSNEFARPVLEHLRKVVHKACPEVTETMKWSFPHFDYKGIMCSMAAFKEHCAFNFWKASLLEDKSKSLRTAGDGGMGNFGRITSVRDLPSEKILTGLIKQAMKLNDEGVADRKLVLAKERTPVPAFLTAALKKNKKAAGVFDGFSNSHRKEYIQWITEAKTEETRKKRLAQTIEWLNEGKPRNWKYLKK